MSIKRLTALFLLITFISFLLAGCTININVGDSAEVVENETESTIKKDRFFDSWNQKTMYESRATIYISNTAAADAAISSSDLKATKSLVETYSVILQSNMIQSQIREEYPDVEYTLSLEPIIETETCTLIATGKNPEYLDEICNMALSLLCEKIPQIVEGSSCKVVNYAKSAQEVGIN